MKKPDPIFGFFMFYSGLLAICFLINEFFFPDITKGQESFDVLAKAIAQCSLTGVPAVPGGTLIPVSYILFSLLITQVSGITFLSFLLWIYRTLYNAGEPGSEIWDSIKLTAKASFIIELILLLFFLYAIPLGLTDQSYQKKIITALVLSVNSFNNAGLPYIDRLIGLEIFEQNFILQIGIIAGTTMGSLGIFVVNELFSPKKLRLRLSHPEIDWSLITKISTFGGILIIVLFSGIFFFSESNSSLKEKNLIESAIISVYEITSARGFGHSFTEYTETPTASLAKVLVSITGSGPFSTGGGLTLLLLAWIYATVKPKRNTSEHMKVSIRLVKNLIVFILTSFIILSIPVILNDPLEDTWTILKNQWSVYSTSQYTIQSSSNWSVAIWKGLTCLAGRMGFIVAGLITLRQQNH